MHEAEAIAVARPQRAPARDLVQDIVRQCLDSARACLRCADECLGSVEVERLKSCIRFALEGADRCFATAALLERPSLEHDGGGTIQALLAGCAWACERAATECRPYARRYEACGLCIEACKRCSAACRSAALVL